MVQVMKVWCELGTRVSSIVWLEVIDRHRFNPLCTPGRSLERISEVLGFMRHFPIPKLHHAYGVNALAFVANHVLGHPQIAHSHDPADRKPRWPARMTTAKRL